MTDLYRISRTTLRGAFESHACMQSFLEQPTAELVWDVADPANDGGDNDRAYVLWRQRGAVVMPAACPTPPDLLSDGGKNGWETIDDATDVLAKFVGQSEALKGMVEAANARAVDPSNIAKGAAEGLAGDAVAVAKGAKGAVEDLAGDAVAAAKAAPLKAILGGGIGIWALGITSGVVLLWGLARFLSPPTARKMGVKFL